jgi:hypothetical protein
MSCTTDNEFFPEFVGAHESCYGPSRHFAVPREFGR